MLQRDYLIVGAGLSGGCACAGIREFDKKGSVLLVGAESFLPYDRVPLSKTFLREAKPSIEKLLYVEPDWYDKHKIEVRLDTIVTAFNLERRLAVLRNGQTFEFRKALLATGSRPRRPQVAGATLGNVFYLHSIRDALAIREVAAVEKNVVVIGGGFTAIETAASLVQAKAKVMLMNRDHAVWQHWLDPETAQWLTRHMETHGVQMMMGEDLNGFEGKTVLKNIQTKSGNRFAAPMAIVAVGSDPNLDLVMNTPLSSPNGTPVNEYLETDEKGIFAAGDIALFPDRVFGGVRRLSHWENARDQARIAGSNMTGRKRIKFDCVPRFFSHVFDLHFEFFGDFGRPPGRMEIDGERARRKFTLRYFQGSKLTSIVHCNQDESRVATASDEIREAQ
jgi:3-phenylpropionate/trans-cinnamate dioxygenase ferredoxin reductase subunit